MANTIAINQSTSSVPINVYAEDLSGSVEMPVVKLHTGAVGTDGGAVTASNPLAVSLAALTGGGATKGKFSNIGGSAWTLQTIKASAGTLFKVHLLQTNNVALYVQIFDVASGSVNPGTTVPDIEILVPANAAGVDLMIDLGNLGVAFTTAINIFLSTGEKGATGTAAGVRAEWFFV